MEFKFYKVTKGAFVERVAEVLEQRNNAKNKLSKFEKEVGASGSYEYNRGGIAFFSFNEKPDMKIWKKAHDGFMPRLGLKGGKELRDKLNAIPKMPIFLDCLSVLNLDNMMVLGESTNRGIAMHSASFVGIHESNTYFIKVPQEKGNEYKPVSNDMVECKEWEMLKFMDEDKK